MLEYQLEFIDCKLQITFEFADEMPWLINVIECEGTPPLTKTFSTAIDMARDFLTRYERFYKNSFYGTLKSTLDKVDEKTAYPITFGNAKLTVKDNSEIRWILTENGVDNASTCVALNYENGFLRYFIDNWRLYVTDSADSVYSTDSTLKAEPHSSTTILTSPGLPQILAAANTLTILVIAAVMLIKKRRRKQQGS
jgi:hypothetical protein